MDDLAVAIWWLQMDGADGPLDSTRRLLSDAERARAATFHFDRDRDRFILRRALRRRVLAHYLEIDPGAVDVVEGHGKKPILSGSMQTGLTFSTSSSGAVAACAVTAGRRIGLDVEEVREVPDLALLSRTALTPTEQRQWEQTDPSTRAASFFRAWTRKEALLKAEGTGLAAGPDTVDVSLDPWPAEAVVVVEHASTRWLLSSWSPGPGIAGSLAVETRAGDSDPARMVDTVRASPPLAGVQLVERRFV